MEVKCDKNLISKDIIFAFEMTERDYKTNEIITRVKEYSVECTLNPLLLNNDPYVQNFRSLADVIKAFHFMAKLGHIASYLTIISISKGVLRLYGNNAHHHNFVNNFSVDYIKIVIENFGFTKDLGTTFFPCIQSEPLSQLLDRCTFSILNNIEYCSLSPNQRNTDMTEALVMTWSNVRNSITFNNNKCISVTPGNGERKFKIFYGVGELKVVFGKDECGDKCLKERRKINIEDIKQLKQINEFFSLKVTNIFSKRYEKHRSKEVLLYQECSDSKQSSENNLLLEVIQKTFQFKELGLIQQQDIDIIRYLKEKKIEFKEETVVVGKLEKKQKNIDQMEIEEESMEVEEKPKGEKNNKKEEKGGNKEEEYKQNNAGFGGSDDDDDNSGGGSKKNTDKDPEEIAKIMDNIFRSLNTNAEEGYAEEAKSHRNDNNGDEADMIKIREIIKFGGAVYKDQLSIITYTVDEFLLQEAPQYTKKAHHFIDTLGKFVGGFDMYLSAYGNDGLQLNHVEKQSFDVF